MRLLSLFLLTLCLIAPARGAVISSFTDTTEFSFVNNSGNSSLNTFHLNNELEFTIWNRTITSDFESFISRSDGKTTSENYLIDARSSKEVWAWKGRPFALLWYSEFTWNKDRFAGIRNRYSLNSGYTAHFRPRIGHQVDSDLGFLYRFEDRIRLAEKQSPSIFLRTAYEFSRGPYKMGQEFTSAFDLADKSNFEIISQTNIEFRLTRYLSSYNRYRLNYRNAPVIGFKNTDHALLIGVIVHWR